LPEYAYNEAHFSHLVKSNEERAEIFLIVIDRNADKTGAARSNNSWKVYKVMADKQGRSVEKIF